MASPPSTKKGEADTNFAQPTSDETGGVEGLQLDEQNTMDPHEIEVEVKEQDRWLPIANVARIMKSALPDNAKIAKEAKECMQECVSEFISFITSEASEKCQQEKRKTVNGEDILFAMTSLGFENYSEALKIYLARYRETLLASTKASAGTSSGANATAGAPGGQAAVAAGAYGEGGLSDDMDGGDAQGYAYGVHPANGSGEY